MYWNKLAEADMVLIGTHKPHQFCGKMFLEKLPNWPEYGFHANYYNVLLLGY